MKELSDRVLYFQWYLIITFTYFDISVQDVLGNTMYVSVHVLITSKRNTRGLTVHGLYSEHMHACAYYVTIKAIFNERAVSPENITNASC